MVHDQDYLGTSTRTDHRGPEVLLVYKHPQTCISYHNLQARRSGCFLCLVCWFVVVVVVVFVVIIDVVVVVIVVIVAIVAGIVVVIDYCCCY